MRRLAFGLGELLITVGAVLLLLVVYELRITTLYTDHAQQDLRQQIRATWRAPAVTAPLAAGRGTGWAVLRIPRFGRDWARVVVQGTGVAELKQGPGHYVGTADPGQVGNVGIAGHRTTYGEPFNRLDEVRPGDALVLETRTQWFTYRVTGQTVVPPTQAHVLDPQPGRRLLTLTTCNPKYSASTRLVLHAVLASTLTKRPNLVPPALA